MVQSGEVGLMTDAGDDEGGRGRGGGRATDEHEGVVRFSDEFGMRLPKEEVDAPLGADLRDYIIIEDGGSGNNNSNNATSNGHIHDDNDLVRKPQHKRCNQNSDNHDNNQVEVISTTSVPNVEIMQPNEKFPQAANRFSTNCAGGEQQPQQQVVGDISKELGLISLTEDVSRNDLLQNNNFSFIDDDNEEGVEQQQQQQQQQQQPQQQRVAPGVIVGPNSMPDRYFRPIRDEESPPDFRPMREELEIEKSKMPGKSESGKERKRQKSGSLLDAASSIHISRSSSYYE